jgi:hypothetical protein
MNEDGGGPKRSRVYPPLMRAIREYYSEAALKQVSMAQVARVAKSGTGSRQELEVVSSFTRAMEVTYGYNKRATLEALNLLAQEATLKRQIEQENQK